MLTDDFLFFNYYYFIMLLFRNKKKLMPEGRWCQINVRRVQLYFYYLAKLGRRTHARNDLNINLLDFILSRDRFICACISFGFFLIFWFKPWQHQLYCVIWFHFSWHLLTDRADHSWKVQFYYDICVCGLHIGQSLRVVIIGYSVLVFSGHNEPDYFCMILFFLLSVMLCDYYSEY